MAAVYFHIDLNAFFANAEILLDPSLKGKPVAVSGTTRRSVVSTASYEARAYGVHSAMPVSEAEKLCPSLVIVQGHHHWYGELSRQFMEIVSRYSSSIEQASIDECYADVTEEIRKYKRPLDLAWRIQKEILDETGLPCSIGVGPNMFLAKMASDMKKPMGITVLRIRDVREKMWPLDIGEMRGVGRKTVPYLKEMGIRTIGDLAVYKDLNELRTVLGKNTEEMIRKANGYDDRRIVSEYDAKSMGVSETLLEDVTDYDEIRGLFRTLSRRLSARMKEDRKMGYLLSIRIRYHDFRNTDRSARQDKPVWKADDLFVGAMSLFDDNWEDEPVRLLGISVSDFVNEKMFHDQMSLFTEAEEKEDIQSVLDDLNRMTGGKTFMKASRLLEKKKNETAESA